MTNEDFSIVTQDYAPIFICNYPNCVLQVSPYRKFNLISLSLLQSFLSSPSDFLQLYSPILNFLNYTMIFFY